MTTPVGSLPAATSITAADYIPVEQAGILKRATPDLLPFTQSGIAPSSNAATRTVAAKLSEVELSIKDAKDTSGSQVAMDGVTDDVTGIQNTYNSLTSGGTLGIPVGTAVINASQLDFSDSKNVVIKGRGMGASVLLVTNAAALGTTPFYGSVKLSDTGAGWKTLKDFTIGRTAYPAALIANDYAIVLGTVQNIVNIERMTLENMASDAILHRGNSATVNVKGCSIRENHFGYGINGSGAAAAIQDFNIEGNSIFGNNGGILISSSVGVLIKGNDVEGAGSGSVAIAAGVPNNPMLSVQANNVSSVGNRYGLPATCNATKVVVLNGENILSVGDIVSIGANTKIGIEVGASAKNVTIIAPQLSAAGTAGSSIGIKILSGAVNTVIINPNFGNTFATEISDAGTNTLILNGNQVYLDWIAGSNAKNNYRTRTISLANNAVSALLHTDVAIAVGKICNFESDAWGEFQTAGASHLVNENSDPFAAFSVTKDNVGTINFYWDAGNSRYEVQNKVGGARTVVLNYYSTV